MYTWVISVFDINSSVMCVLSSKELLSRGEECCSICERISVHSFSCWTPLTRLCERKKNHKTETTTTLPSYMITIVSIEGYNYDDNLIT